jgi:hypothetical protein
MLDGFAASVVAATGSVVVAKAVVMKVLALVAHAPVGKELLWLIAAWLVLLVLAQFAAACLGFLHNHPSPGHLLLHQSKEFIFLRKACQLIFNDSPDFFLRILLHIF